MHPEAARYLVRTLRRLPAPKVIVELGSRSINGSVRQWVRAPWYVGIDIREGPGVDVVADAASYVPEVVPDLVVCTEMFEHCAYPMQVGWNVFRMLAPGGAFIVTTAYEGRAPHSAVDGGPLREGEFYRNASRDDLRFWLAPFAHVEIEIDEEAHDIYALAWKATE